MDHQRNSRQLICKSNKLKKLIPGLLVVLICADARDTLLLWIMLLIIIIIIILFGNSLNKEQVRINTL